MICVLRTADEGLASLVKSMFDGEGVRYVVRGEGLPQAAASGLADESTESDDAR